MFCFSREKVFFNQMIILNNKKKTYHHHENKIHAGFISYLILSGEPV